MTETSAPITGFSHVQLIVRDLAQSVQWYSRALGLVHYNGSEADGYVALRHVPSRVVIVLTQGQASAPPAGTPDRVLDHLAFAVPDGAMLEDWAAQLTGLGIDNPGVVDELGKPSLLLTDPDGNHIELVAPPGTHRESAAEGS